MRASRGVSARAGAGTPHVVFGHVEDADERLAPAWDDLAAAASEPNAFSERWFVTAGLHHLPHPPSLRLLEAWDDARLIGLLPLAIDRRYGRLPVRHVVNWLHHHAFLGTPMVRAGCEQAFWAAVLNALDAQGWARGFLHVNGLVEDGPVHRGLIAAAGAAGRRCDTVHRAVRAQLDSGLSPVAYYEANVRKKKRKELKRLAARLAECGAVAAARLERADQVPGWCDDFLALEASGWKGRGGSALASRPETRAFFREMLAGAWAAGRLEVLRMTLDDRPIAMLVNFLAPPGAFSFKIAFDEDFARFSPGVLIQIENLRLLHDADIAWMDSCAAENHPMIDSLWGGRRAIVRVTVPLAGMRRRLTFTLARAAERARAFIRSRGKR
ncbi:MAG: GNAT family N-acetyltransferase [Sphingomonas sp.]